MNYYGSCGWQYVQISVIGSEASADTFPLPLPLLPCSTVLIPVDMQRSKTQNQSNYMRLRTY